MKTSVETPSTKKENIPTAENIHGDHKKVSQMFFYYNLKVVNG